MGLLQLANAFPSKLHWNPTLGISSLASKVIVIFFETVAGSQRGTGPGPVGGGHRSAPFPSITFVINTLGTGRCPSALSVEMV